MYAHQPFRLSFDLFRTATYNQLAGKKKKKKKNLGNDQSEVEIPYLPKI